MRTATVPTIPLPSGETIPVLGQGTRQLGEDPARRSEEVEALRVGIELGMTLIDTSESFGDGAAEELVGEAVAAMRDDTFLVSKVLPLHASLHGTVEACERSLQRLRTDRLDLYMLQGTGNIPFEVTVDAFETLKEDGKIRHWGVCDFGMDDMQYLVGPAGGAAVQADEVLYNLLHRGVEWDLLPWLRANRVATLAYSPIEEGRLLRHPALEAVAERCGATPAQVALAWVMRQPDVSAVARASRPEHTRENRGALDVQLVEIDLVELDDAFPPPVGPRDLEAL
jgi:diketogulonate reductase-like aldo/keto reductase